MSKVPKVLDVETTGDPLHGGELLVLGWDNIGWFNHPSSSLGTWADLVTENLADPDQPMITHTKYDVRWLRLADWDVKGQVYDTQVMAWVLNENQPLDLESLAKKYTGIVMDKRLKKMSGRVMFRRDDGQYVPIEEAPVDQLVAYNERDLVTTQKLFDALSSIMDDTAWRAYYEAEELPFTGVLLDMECNGMPIDLEATEELRVELTERLTKQGEALDQMLGYHINYGSWQQLVDVLFSKVFHQKAEFEIPEEYRDRFKKAAWRESWEGDEEDALPFEDWKRLSADLIAPKGFVSQSVGRLKVKGYYVRRGLGLKPTPPEVDKFGKKADHPSTRTPALLVHVTKLLGELDEKDNAARKGASSSSRSTASVQPLERMPSPASDSSREENRPLFDSERPSSLAVRSGTPRQRNQNRQPARESMCTSSDSSQSLRNGRSELELGIDFIQELTKWRKVEKALEFVEAYPRHTHEGRIYPRFNQTGTVTGRLSSSDPNFQNVPAHGELGKSIRSLFTGNLIVGDYSQLEPRLMAHLSQDPVLIDAYRTGKDIYLTVANGIFGGNISKEDDERQISKTVFLAGPSYGAGPGKVAAILCLNGYPTTTNTAADYLDELYALLPGLGAYQEHAISEAHRKGYVTTIGGRHRRLSYINDKNWKLMKYGERQAVNAEVQGSAGDIVRRAMIRCQKFNDVVAMLAQIHDEMVFERLAAGVPDPYILKALKATCEDVGFKLDVPLVFEPEFCKSWAEKGSGVGIEMLPELEDA